MKRLILLILSLSFVFSLCAVPAQAESEITVQIYNNTDTSAHSVYSTTVANKAYIIGSVEVGDTIYFSRVFSIGSYMWGEVYSINYDSTLAGNFVLLGSYKYTYMGETTVISDSDVDSNIVSESDVSSNADSDSETSSNTDTSELTTHVVRIEYILILFLVLGISAFIIYILWRLIYLCF